jgi:hypothetical protein
MRRLRTSLMLLIVSVALILMSQAALAQQLGREQGCNQQGNQTGNNQGCPPGAPTLSESHFAVLLPLIAIALVGGIICVVFLRQRARLRAAN